MIRNADYVMTLITDSTNRAKKAQVGVDLTVNAINSIMLCPLLEKEEGSKGFIYNDESIKSGEKNSYGFYSPVSLSTYKDRLFYILNPGVYSIEFEQGLTPLPETNTAFIYHRSTLGRNGALIRSAVYDPGFTTPKMGAILEVWRQVYIEQYARVAQIVIYENESADLYDGQYQGIKDKR